MTCHDLKLDKVIVQLTFLDLNSDKRCQGAAVLWYSLYELLFNRNDSCSLNEFNIFPVKTIEFQYMNYRKIYIMYKSVTFVKKT